MGTEGRETQYGASGSSCCAVERANGSVGGDGRYTAAGASGVLFRARATPGPSPARTVQCRNRCNASSLFPPLERAPGDVRDGLERLERVDGTRGVTRGAEDEHAGTRGHRLGQGRLRGAGGEGAREQWEVAHAATRTLSLRHTAAALSPQRYFAGTRPGKTRTDSYVTRRWVGDSVGTPPPDVGGGWVRG